MSDFKLEIIEKNGLSFKGATQGTPDDPQEILLALKSNLNQSELIAFNDQIKQAELIAAQTRESLLKQSLRDQRDILLAESDWTQGKDISEYISQKWAPYRQALRDLTNQAEFPQNVTWPVKPI